MKEIRAYIQPFVLGRVVQGLLELPGFPGMSVMDCEGFGQCPVEEGQDFNPFKPKKRLEIVVEDDRVDEVIAIIMKYAHTGRSGDGQVCVFDVARSGRIRTGVWSP